MATDNWVSDKSFGFFRRFILPIAALSIAGLSQAQMTAKEGAESSMDFFARDTLRIETFACPFKNDIEYEPGEIECGLLQVPENREKPDSRFIELHFVKLNSTWDDDEDDEDEEDESGLAPGKRDDVVIYLTGGPGAHASTYVERFKDHRIRRHRDMYILEQRGIGYSADFCPNYNARKPERFDVASYEEQEYASIAAADDCANNASNAGVDLTGYN
ncbi:MAG: hypothetical protein WBM34_13010, partial [Woeseiaceae bacterium]